jgi:transposase InsO family protein
MLVELAAVELRYRAVLEVLEGAPVTEVARRFGVARQTVHRWLVRYAGDGLADLADRSTRPRSCPHQIPVVVEARVLALRLAHPGWGPDRILFQLGREAERGELAGRVPSRSGIYRALARHRLLEPQTRRRRRSDYKRWERTRPMALWQMDVMGGVLLADGAEVKVVTGIDDHSRFVVCARLVARATAGPVCAALRHALGAHGVPEQILTDNGKVFTGRFATGAGAGGPVLFDRICVENGIRHLLTAPYSPTTTGKVERLHKTMRAEFFDLHVREWADLCAAQAALDGWVLEYNTDRPHRACGGRVPAERFTATTTAAAVPVVADPVPVVEVAPAPSARPGGVRPGGVRPGGVSRWVDQGGAIRLAGAVYRVGSAFAGEQVEVVARGGLVEICHAGVLIATHVQRRSRGQTRERLPTQRAARPATAGLAVTRIVDASGAVSFAGTMYRAGRSWARRSVQVSIVAGSVQISAGGTVIRVHPIRHDRAKEHGAFATPNGRPRRDKPAPQPAAGVKANAAARSA